MSVELVARALHDHRERFAAAERVFVGFSGGLDSTVLLHALGRSDLADPIAVHVNHSLHGDAAQWEQHCAAFCAAAQISFRREPVQVVRGTRGIEAAAREARYRCFEETLGAADLLLLAHHQDDQVETLLLRLLRGSGPDGLAAMPVTRPLGRGRLLRPLLDVPRSALLRYAQVQGLTWVEDPSNGDEHFDRNYLRRQVLPAIEARWPAYRRVFSRTAGLLREASMQRDSLAPATVHSVTGDPGFPCVDLPADPARAALLVRSWLRVHGLAMPGRARLHEFLRQLREGQGATLQASTWTLTRFRGAVYAHSMAHSAGGAACEPKAILVGDPIHWLGIGDIALEVRSRAPGVVLTGEFSVRGRRHGERLATATGEHRSVKKILQDAGVPPWWRDRVPLLYEVHGEARRLVAVGGFAAAPRLKELGLNLVWRPDVLKTDVFRPPGGADFA